MTSHLGAFDLAVPIGPLDQSHHEAASGVTGNGRHGLHRLERALLIGLNRQTQTLPGSKLRLTGQTVQQLQRKDQTVGFLSIQGKVDVGARRNLGQAKEPRIKISPNTGFVTRLITGRKG